MKNNTRFLTLLLSGVFISGVSFLISFIVKNILIESISFAFIIAMLFFVILSPKSMWKIHTLQNTINENKNE